MIGVLTLHTDGVPRAGGVACRDEEIRGSARNPSDETHATQLKLPGYEYVPDPSLTCHRRPDSAAAKSDTPLDPLVGAYLRRLRARGAAKKGYDAYHYQIRTIARIAAQRKGRVVSMEELFQDITLLGNVLVDDTTSTRGEQLSKWTLAQRRSAIRSFATLVRSELLERVGEDPRHLVDQALRRVAVRVGSGYQLTGGNPRNRGGYVPSREEIRSVLQVLGEQPGYLGLRNQCFFSILGASGARVNALRGLDGADCVEMPSGRIRVFVHDKGKPEPREIELSRELSAMLRAYVVEFNAHAARQSWRTRITIGAPGAIWRNSQRGRWSYASVRLGLATACEQAGVAPFRPHTFRRAFATEAASVLPRYIVARAGGWHGIDRLDNHYVCPSIHDGIDKLHRQREQQAISKERLDGAATPLQLEHL